MILVFGEGIMAERWLNRARHCLQPIVHLSSTDCPQPG
jgi:hypothetical protein